MIDPLLSIKDICKVLRSICQAHAQEHLSFPLHYTIDDFDISVTEFLRNTPVSEWKIANQLTTMFSCPELIDELQNKEKLSSWATLVHATWAKNPKTITFFTSGSTGESTLQCHPVEYLLQEASNLAGLFAKNRSRVVASAPSHHIYGFLFTILLPKLAKLACAFPPLFPTAEYCRKILPGDLIISFPLFWKAIITLDIPLAENVQGITSTAPCPKEILADVTKINLARIYNIYGSSETGGLGFQTKPEEPFTLLPFWMKSSLSDGDTSIRRQTIDGFDKSHLEKVDDLNYPPFWQDINMPDHVQWISEEKFIIAGRKDKLVQVGGKNISLQETTKLLLGHDYVAACSVRLMRPEEGNRLKCFVVPKRVDLNEKELRRELNIFCRQHLSPASRPKKITIGNELPVNELGKLKDW